MHHKKVLVFALNIMKWGNEKEEQMRIIANVYTQQKGCSLVGKKRTRLYHSVKKNIKIEYLRQRLKKNDPNIAHIIFICLKL